MLPGLARVSLKESIVPPSRFGDRDLLLPAAGPPMSMWQLGPLRQPRCRSGRA